MIAVRKLDSQKYKLTVHLVIKGQVHNFVSMNMKQWHNLFSVIIPPVHTTWGSLHNALIIWCKVIEDQIHSPSKWVKIKGTLLRVSSLSVQKSLFMLLYFHCSWTGKYSPLRHRGDFFYQRDCNCGRYPLYLTNWIFTVSSLLKKLKYIFARRKDCGFWPPSLTLKTHLKGIF